MDGRIVVSAAGTGHGKTLVATALCRAFSKAGRRVQPYKIGPDYIDAGFYERVCGRPAYNVDAWLDGEAGVLEHVAATSRDVDTLVFEGMMGLFDGDDDGATSTAQLARSLDAAVVLVVDCWTASQTAAAVALGCATFDPAVRVAGVILNRIAGERHEEAVRAAFARTRIPILAVVRYDAELEARERHLGLDPREVEKRAAGLERVADSLLAQIDLHRFGAHVAPGIAARELRATVRIGIASDAAFTFTYAETLAALRAAGAETVAFSPLADAALPAGIGGLWLGGGYPELHAARLERNEALRWDIKSALQRGMPAYAECGGMMYLAERLATAQGTYAMAGVLRGSTSIAVPRLHIGYRTARVLRDGPLERAGVSFRGYEYHYAVSELDESPAYAFEDGRFDGAARPNLTAGFVHRHFLAESPAIRNFVEAAVAWASRARTPGLPSE